MSSKLFKNKLSVATLAVRYNDKLESVCINDYRVNGVKWNDVENGRYLATSIKLDDVLKALGVYKEITDLQHRLEVAERTTKLVCDELRNLNYKTFDNSDIDFEQQFKEQAEKELKEEKELKGE